MPKRIAIAYLLVFFVNVSKLFVWELSFISS
nr:MAG TPA: hypothetical protein [Crassvirales sp.]